MATEYQATVAYFQEFSRGKKFILKDISHEKKKIKIKILGDTENKTCSTSFVSLNQLAEFVA